MTADEGRGLSHDRMDFHLGVATCRCGWTGPQGEAQAHLLANPLASVAGRVATLCHIDRWGICTVHTTNCVTRDRAAVVHEDYCGYPDDCNCVKTPPARKTTAPAIVQEE